MIKQEIGRRVRAACNGFEPPKDLSTCADIDSNEQVASVDVSDIWQKAQGLFATGMHPYLSLCIRHRGDIVMNRSLGYSQLNWNNVEASPLGNIDTPVCLFSASKTPTAMLLHKLAERGQVDLLNPVSHYLPAFAKHGKADITLYDLLSHRSGFPFIDADIDVDMVFDLDAVFDLICDMPCLNPDGRVQAYHAVSGGFVVAKLVQEVTGESISTLLNDTFRQPLGMRNFNYGYLGTSDTPVAHNYNTGGPEVGFFNRRLARCIGLPFDEITEVSNEERFHRAVVPSGNMYSTAEELSRFYQMMLNEGEWNGEQVLEPTTIRHAVREAGPARFDRAIGLPFRFSAGMMLGGKPVGMYGRNTHQAYGHLGLSNIFSWADPQRDLAVGIVTSGKPVLGPHIVPLLQLINSISSSFDTA